jgi:hypothetical protein
MDALAQAVSLQSRLNEAVEKQDFALAVTLRDQLQAAKVCLCPAHNQIVWSQSSILQAPDKHAHIMSVCPVHCSQDRGWVVVVEMTAQRAQCCTNCEIAVMLKGTAVE